MKMLFNCLVCQRETDDILAFKPNKHILHVATSLYASLLSCVGIVKEWEIIKKTSGYATEQMSPIEGIKFDPEMTLK